MQQVVFDWHFREVEDNYFIMTFKSQDIRNRTLNFIFKKAYNQARRKMIKENPKYKGLPKHKILETIDRLPVPSKFYHLVLNGVNNVVCQAKKELKADGIIISYMNIKDAVIIRQKVGWVVCVETEGGHVRKQVA